jgi:hypothetical protein
VTKIRNAITPSTIAKEFILVHPFNEYDGSKKGELFFVFSKENRVFAYHL